MNLKIKRRTMILGMGGAGLAATLPTFRPAYAAGPELHVSHFGGPYEVLNDVVAKPFEAAGKGSVAYDVEISPTAFAKIQNQKNDPPYDVIMISRAWGLRALKSGLLEKVSPSDFSQSGAVLPEIIPEAGWGAATMLDTIDLMVDTKQIPTPVTSWLDLWRDDMKGKIMLPSAVNGSTAFGFLACLVKAIGGDMTDPSALDDAFARLKALKPAIRSFYADGSQPNQLMERGDIGIAPQFAIRIANSTRVAPHIKKASPDEGMLAVPYDLCIPVNSKNIDAAKAYIDFTLSKTVQEGLVTNLLATPVRADVTVPETVAPLVNADPSKVWFQDEEFAAIKQREWLDRYTREVQS